MESTRTEPNRRQDHPEAGTPDPAALMVAEHLASLGTLVAGVAHEINNPITYVIGNLKELERLCGSMRDALQTYRDRFRAELGDSADALIEDVESKVDAAGGLDVLDELLGDASEGATRIRDLVRDLLSLSRGSERTTAPVGVEDILESTLRLVSRPMANSATLVRDFAATKLIEGDRAKLGQVFLNLLNNAIDACKSGDPERHRITVRTRDTDDGIRIEFEDTGVGIADEVSKQIFTPFFTTKEPGEGTGLGLYISQRIVDDHEGTLAFRRAESGGAIACLDLPERRRADLDSESSEGEHDGDA